MEEIFTTIYLCDVYLILIDIIYYRRNKYMTEKQQTKKKVALLKELCHYQMELTSLFLFFFLFFNV